jgi:hypothetical protein
MNTVEKNVLSVSVVPVAMKGMCAMSGLPVHLSKQKTDIITVTAVPLRDGDFVWNGKNEDDRPLTKQEMYESIRKTGALN